jgi:hypothetical protein
MAATIDSALASFIHEGLAAHIGTRTDSLEPNGARVTAVRVEPDGAHIVAYIPTVAGLNVLADLESNGQAAVTITRPVDDRSCQVKGVMVSSWAATDDERAFALRQWDGFLAQLGLVGLPPIVATNWNAWPCMAVRIRVTSLFDQTPGPVAGTPLS